MYVQSIAIIAVQMFYAEYESKTAILASVLCLISHIYV